MRTWQIDAYACFLGALLLLTLPLNWLLAAAAAAVFHELCHGLAVKVMGGRVLNVTIGPGGAVMETSPMSRGKELVCILAGPFGSLFLLSAYRIAPRVALCAGIHGAYNLLPVYPLDGGRALRRLTDMVLPAKAADRLCNLAEGGTLLTIFLLSAAAAAVLHLGLMPLLWAFMLIIKKNTLQTGASRGTIVLPYTKR